MKKLLLNVVTLLSIQFSYTQNVKGPYFGQTPPGDTPRLFAPGILTLPGGIVAVTRIAFSPDGNECFFSGPVDWSYSSTRMYHTKCVDSIWTPHELVSFFPGYSCRQPWFSASGDTLYFSSNKNGTSDIWMVVCATEGWGTPQVLPDPINTSSYDGMYTRTTDGTIYIESDRPGGYGKIDVWRISPQNGIQNLGVPVNTSGDDNDPFVSPDGKYLIFGSNYNDLFIIFNKGNSRWTAPVNLNKYYPDINTGNQEYAPFLSTDGRFLFFNRIADGGMFWVSTKCIDSLKNINFPPYVKNGIPDQTAKKDSLFNYQVPDSTFFDDDGNNSLTYSAILSNGGPLPSWLRFGPGTSIFSGRPDTSGTFKINVTATDSAMASASAQFTLTIHDNPTSINIMKGQKLSIFPNPTSGLISLYIGTTQNQQAIVEVFNIEGKSMLAQTIQNTGNATIDLSDCPKGMYVLNLVMDDERFNVKICLK